MEKKTKALAVAAAGALAVGIALSAASCALRPAATEQPAPQETAPMEEAVQGQSENASATTGAYELACSKAWKSDAGSLQMSKGMVVEKGADGRIHVLTVSEAKEADAGEQALITVSGTDEDSQAAATWTLVLDRSGGAATISSDGFKVSKAYTEDVAEGSVSVGGMDEAYIGLVGGDAEPLREALASYMARNVPQATSASFDGEASVDFNAKSVSATFHADDAARTVLTVTYANGAFTVSG